MQSSGLGRGRAPKSFDLLLSEDNSNINSLLYKEFLKSRFLETTQRFLTLARNKLLARVRSPHLELVSKLEIGQLQATAAAAPISPVTYSYNSDDVSADAGLAGSSTALPAEMGGRR